MADGFYVGEPANWQLTVNKDAAINVRRVGFAAGNQKVSRFDR